MNEIRLLALKAIRYMLIGSLLPVLGLLILAFYSKPVRRFLLWVMVPLAALAVWSYIIFAPIPPGEIKSIEDVMAAYRRGMLESLPYLIGLVLLAAAGIFGGPKAVQALRKNRRDSARRRYLRQLVEWVEPQLSRFKTLPEIRPQDLPSHLWVSGPAGVGKSLLLRSLLLAQARQALEDETLPLPILLDLDLLAPEEGEPTSLEVLQPAVLPASESLLENEMGTRGLSLLIDSSQMTFAPVFTAQPLRERRLEALVKIIEAFLPTRLVVALPEGVQSLTLDRLIPDRLPIEPLSSAEIRQGVRKLAGDKAEPMLQALETPESSWNGLAGRWLVLEKLARFFARRQRAPADARELFRETLYQGLPAEKVEEALSRLASALLNEGRAALPLEQAAGLLEPLKAQDLERAGLLQIIPGAQQAGFPHPLYLAYFSALAWLEGRSTQPDLASALGIDPLLGDALIFFNNLLADPAELERTIHDLAEQTGPGAQILAAQCLLAAPASRRSPALVEKLAARLVKTFSGGGEGPRLAWLLLDHLDDAGRLRVWEAALPELDRAQLGLVLSEIFRRIPGDLRAILWYGKIEVSRLAARAWAEEEPRQAFAMLKEMFESGPPARKRTAIEMMVNLPREAAGVYLTALLQSERPPDLRLAILNSLAGAGAADAPALLEIIADPRETDEVRACAVEVLGTCALQELQSARTLREIVRISRMPVPEPVRHRLAGLLEQLRSKRQGEAAADPIERWENLLNPYRPGRPLTERGLFYGRETLMHALRSVIENGSHAVLIGERQSGKTTVLQQLRLELAEEAAQGVAVRGAYIDLAGLQPHEFFETILRLTVEQMNDPRLAAEPQIPRPYTSTHFERDLGELLAFLQDSLGSGVRLALLLDEADELLNYPQAFHASLQRIFSSPAAERLSVILAGRGLQQGWRRPDPPFYASYPVYPLPPLTREDAVRLITEPAADIFKYEPDALELILENAQGRPADLQAVCQQLVNDLLASGERLVTARHIREALGQAKLARGELLSQAGRLLAEMLDWVEDNPDAPQADLQARLKQTWEELGRTMVKGVAKIRSGTGHRPGS